MPHSIGFAPAFDLGQFNLGSWGSIGALPQLSPLGEAGLGQTARPVFQDFLEERIKPASTHGTQVLGTDKEWQARRGLGGDYPYQPVNQSGPDREWQAIGGRSSTRTSAYV